MIESIQQVNQDIQIHNNYVQAGSSPTLAELRPCNFSSKMLHNALKKRNQEYARNLESRKQPQLPQPIRQLRQRVFRQKKLDTFQVEKESARKELAPDYKSQFYCDRLTISQEEFVTLHEQHEIKKQIFVTNRKRSKIQYELRQRQLQSIEGIKDHVDSSPSRILSNKRIEEQNSTNKERYLQFIKRRILRNDENVGGFQQFTSFNGEVAQLWRIIVEQLKFFSNAAKIQGVNPQFGIINASISLIEEQFRREVPSFSNEKQLSQFMRKKYVSGSSNYNFQTNREGILTWAVPFAYYRAGVRPNFIVSLHSQGRAGIQLREQFDKFEQSVSTYNPTPQHFIQRKINDTFYEQLVSIVKGQSKFEQRLCQFGSLDLIWLILKLIKIYTFSQQNKLKQFQQMTQAVLYYFQGHRQHYKSASQKIIPYCQFLYLGAYDSFVRYYQKCPNTLSHDDYLHILLVLNSKPEIMSHQNYEILAANLEKQLSQFISVLLYSEYKQYAIFYILSIPKQQQFINVVNNVFTSWDIFDLVNSYVIDGLPGWNYIKFRYDYELESETFEIGMNNVLKNMIVYENDTQVHLRIVKVSQELLSNPLNYMNIALLIWVRYLMKVQSQSIVLHNFSGQKSQPNLRLSNSISETIDRYMSENEFLAEEYGPLVKFLHDFCSLSQIVANKNFQKQEEFLKREPYIGDLPLLLSKQTNVMKDMADKLTEYDSFRLFVQYLKKVINISEKVYHMRGLYDKIKKLKQSLLATLSHISQKNKYEVGELIQYINN